MRARPNRAIKPDEAAVLIAALSQAPCVAKPELFLEGVEQLRVVDQCECGCASVDFAEVAEARGAKPIADGMGRTEAGGTVGVIVWGKDSRITALEVYDLGAGDEDQRLPAPETITPFGEGAAR